MSRLRKMWNFIFAPHMYILDMHRKSCFRFHHFFLQRKQSLYPVLQTALFDNQSVNVPTVCINPEIALQVFSLDTIYIGPSIHNNI
jgi:hypothetical protein